MNSNVHFVDYCLINNQDKIYDTQFLINNILCTCDIAGMLKYYQISKENGITYAEIDTIETGDVSIFTLDSYEELTLAGMENGQVSIFSQAKNHNSLFTVPPTSISISTCKFINESLIAIGDNNGKVDLYDIKAKPTKPIASLSEQSDEISAIAHTSDHHNHLLTTSIDGTLCAYDIRKFKLYALSDCIEEEINCCQIVRSAEKIACGTGEGNIALWNWDWFGDYKDRIVGHPEGILCLEKYNDNLLLSGCEDGGVRINSVFPKGVRGMISEKRKVKMEEKEFGDVTAMGINAEEGEFLAAVSNIKYVKVFDISMIDFGKIDNVGGDEEESDDDDNEEKERDNNSSKDKENDDDDVDDMEEDDGTKGNKKKKGRNIKEKKKKGKDESDEDEEDNEQDEDEDDDDDEEEEEDDNEQEEEEDEDEEENEEEGKEGDNKKKGNKKTLREKKEKSSDISISENNNLSDSDNNDNKNKDHSSKDDNDDDSDSDSDSTSKKKKRKSKKVECLGKKRTSEAIISKERRKDFFSDL